MPAHIITIITFAVYAFFIMCVTYAAYQRTDSHADYILADRSLNSYITAMGVAASDMSSWLMLSLPGIVYAFGLNQIWLPVSLFIGSYFNWKFVAPRLRIYTEKVSALTLPAFFENRFCEKAPALRYIATVLFLIFFTVYAGSGLVGGAKLFVTAFNLDYMIALHITAPLIIFYAVVGGYFAVNWIDLFQGTLMLMALVLIPVCAFGDFGGFDNALIAIKEVAPTKMNPFYDLALFGFLSSMAWGLGYFGQPHILVRFMSSRDSKSIKIGMRICLTWMAIALAGAVAIGFFGIAYFAPGSLPSDEAVMPALTQVLVNPWLASFVFAAVVSAIMSTVAAVIIAAGSALINDVYKHVFRPQASQKELVNMGRLCVLAISLAAYLLAALPNPSVFALVAHAWGGLGASFGPVVLVSLYARHMNKTSAILGMVMGGLTALVWAFLHDYVGGGVFEVYELVPGFFMGLVGIGLGYYFDKPNAQAIAHFDEMRAQCTQK